MARVGYFAFVLCLLALCPIPTLSQENLGGPVTGNLTIPQGVHYVNADLEVEGQLTIDAGAVLYFSQNTGITVHGVLNVNGREDAAVFMLAETSGAKWDGITFKSDALPTESTTTTTTETTATTLTTMFSSASTQPTMTTTTKAATTTTPPSATSGTPGQCGELSDVDDITVTYRTSSLDGRQLAEYSCPDHFTFMGISDLRACQEDGTWGGLTANCKLGLPEASLNCPTLSILFGTVSYISLVTDQVALFKCNPGFRLTEFVAPICLDRGWSANPPFCVPEDSCNTSADCPDQYVCDDRSQTCHCNGFYNDDGICERVNQDTTCGDLTVENGFANYFSHRVGGLAYFLCSEGQVIDYDLLRYCQNDGTWSSKGLEQPTCATQATCAGELPQIPDDGFAVPLSSTAVRYQCRKGFALMGRTQNSCQGNERWGETPVLCINEAIVELHDVCEDLSIDHGFVKYSYSPQTSVFFAIPGCDAGYRLSKFSSPLCQKPDGWVGHLPQCVPETACEDDLGCGESEFCSLHSSTCYCNGIRNSAGICEPVNGTVDCGPYLADGVFGAETGTSVGHMAAFICYPNTVLVGDTATSVTVCQNDGNWSEQQPQCVAVSASSRKKRQAPESRVSVVQRLYMNDTIFGLNIEDGFQVLVQSVLSSFSATNGVTIHLPCKQENSSYSLNDIFAFNNDGHGVAMIGVDDAVCAVSVSTAIYAGENALAGLYVDGDFDLLVTTSTFDSNEYGVLARLRDGRVEIQGCLFEDQKNSILHLQSITSVVMVYSKFNSSSEINVGSEVDVLHFEFSELNPIANISVAYCEFERIQNDIFGPGSFVKATGGVFCDISNNIFFGGSLILSSEPRDRSAQLLLVLYSNVFTENSGGYYSGSLLLLNGLPEDRVVIYGNSVRDNNALFFTEIYGESSPGFSSSETAESVLIERNYIANNTFYSNTISLYGYTDVTILHNVLDNPSAACELEAPTFHALATTDARGNYWGQADIDYVLSRVCSFDTDLNKAYVDYLPYSVTENHEELSLPNGTFDALGRKGGEVQGEKRLSGSNVISRSILVRPGATLIVEPGADLQFQPDRGIICAGGVLAIQGTAADRVQLAPHVIGTKWYGIRWTPYIQEDTESSRKKRQADTSVSSIEYADVSLTERGISIHGDPVAINNLQVMDTTSSGISVELTDANDTATIQDTTIINGDYDGIAIYGPGSFELHNIVIRNTFFECLYQSSDGIVHLNITNLQVSSCFGVFFDASDGSTMIVEDSSVSTTDYGVSVYGVYDYLKLRGNCFTENLQNDLFLAVWSTGHQSASSAEITENQFIKGEVIVLGFNLFDTVSVGRNDFFESGNTTSANDCLFYLNNFDTLKAVIFENKFYHIQNKSCVMDLVGVYVESDGELEVSANHFLNNTVSESVVTCQSTTYKLPYNIYENPHSMTDLRVAVNDPSLTVNASHSWWGSTDLAVVESRIHHNVDDDSLALVLFEPILMDRGFSCAMVNDCHGNGNCVATDLCWCYDSWTGIDCAVKSCSFENSCHGNGECIDADSCACFYGWSGSFCEVPTCESLSGCHGYGDCTQFDYCECNSGFTGEDCGLITCSDFNDCNGNGECTGPNLCACFPGWTGEQCLVSECLDLEACNGRGDCLGPNQCQCYDGWSGEACSELTCPENTWGPDCLPCPACVSEQGSCNLSTGLCLCQAGWVGDLCQTAGCTDLGDCHGNGVCVGPSQCQCDPQHAGSDCSGCAALHWGPECQPCPACVNGQCDTEDTGSCVCQDINWTGVLCDECSASYYGPSCLPLETVLSLEPDSGLDRGNDLVLVRGDNFPETADGVYYCRFGGETVQGRRLSDQEVECLAPAMPAGDVTVEVSADGEIYTTNGVVYTYTPTCPVGECGRQLIPPKGECRYGGCSCNLPYIGSTDCDTVLHPPLIDTVESVQVLGEGELYGYQLTLSQGSQPVLWEVVTAPPEVKVNPRSGLVTWRHPVARQSPVTVSIRASNLVGMDTVKWSVSIPLSYSATIVQSSPDGLLPTAQSVTLVGTLTFFDGHQPRPVPVEIRVKNNDELETVVATVNTETSDPTVFQVIYHPRIGESGFFSAGAFHPQNSEYIAEVIWSVSGMRCDPMSFAWSSDVDYGQQTTLAYNSIGTLVNTGGFVIRDIYVAVEGAGGPLLEAFVTFRDVFGASHEGPLTELLETGSVDFDLNLVVLYPLSGNIRIIFSSVSGTMATMDVTLNFLARTPFLEFQPKHLVGTVARGNQKTFEIQVTNSGKLDALAVSVYLPESSGLHLVAFTTEASVNDGTPDESFSIPSGESGLLVLSLFVANDTELGERNGDIRVYAQFASFLLGYTLYITSDSCLNLRVLVEDEYTYFTEDAPLVPNAVVRLLNTRSGVDELRTAAEVNTGVVFEDILEDRYTLIVSAPGHASQTLTILATPEDNTVYIFLARQAVTYTWTVQPTTFEDKYLIEVESTFETDVPMPVVTVEPVFIDTEPYELGLKDKLELVVSNHGIIRTEDTQVFLPKHHPTLMFEQVTDDIGALEAKTSGVVVVKVTPRSREKRGLIEELAEAACDLYLLYAYYCGELRTRYLDITMARGTDIAPIPCSALKTLGQGRRQIDNYSGTGPLGTTSLSGYSFLPSSGAVIIYEPETPVSCDCAKTLIKSCGLGFHPVAGCMIAAEGAISVLDEPTETGLDKVVFGLELVLGLIDTAFACVIGNLCQICGAIYSSLRCLVDILNTCSGPERRRREVSSGVILDLSYKAEPLLNYMDMMTEIFGSEEMFDLGETAWVPAFRSSVALDSELDEGLSSAETAAILDAVTSSSAAVTLETFLQRWNNTVDAWYQGTINDTENLSNVISPSDLDPLVNQFADDTNTARDAGYDSIFDSFDAAHAEYQDTEQQELQAGDDGVCAKVRIKITQDLVLTRDAFNARLEIDNGETAALENIRVEIEIRESLGSRDDGIDRFSIGQPNLVGITGVDGTGMLAQSMSGYAEWLMVPYSSAASVEDTLYDVGGWLYYTVNGADFSVELLPDTITVRPTSSLIVHYFLEKFVQGDDPSTAEVIEESVPFVLAVMVTNNGYGAARDLRITAAQPVITENEKGLLVNFQIIGAQIYQEPVIRPSLTIDFGNIHPFTTKTATWLLTSSLKGTFEDYSVTFENINPLGDPQLSILEELHDHELFHVASIDSEGAEDAVDGFLVNDVVDQESIPDKLYDSSNIFTVYNVSEANITRLVTFFTEQRQEKLYKFALLTLSAHSGGWFYGRVNNTIARGDQELLLFAQSYDLRVIQVDKNAWLTTQIFDTHLFHILDYAPNSANDTQVFNYAVIFGPRNLYSPQFAKQDYDVNVTLSTPPNTTLTTITANDDDDNEMQYNVYPQYVGDPEILAVKADTGELYLTEALSSETPQTLMFILTAADNGIPSQTSNVLVSVNIVDAQTTTELPTTSTRTTTTTMSTTTTTEPTISTTMSTTTTTEPTTSTTMSTTTTTEPTTSTTMSTTTTTEPTTSTTMSTTTTTEPTTSTTMSTTTTSEPTTSTTMSTTTTTEQTTSTTMSTTTTTEPTISTTMSTTTTTEPTTSTTMSTTTTTEPTTSTTMTTTTTTEQTTSTTMSTTTTTEPTTSTTMSTTTTTEPTISTTMSTTTTTEPPTSTTMSTTTTTEPATSTTMSTTTTTEPTTSTTMSTTTTTKRTTTTSPTTTTLRGRYGSLGAAGQRSEDEPLVATAIAVSSIVAVICLFCGAVAAWLLCRGDKKSSDHKMRTETSGSSVYEGYLPYGSLSGARYTGRFLDRSGMREEYTIPYYNVGYADEHYYG